MESGRSVEQIIREIVPRLTGDEDQDEDVFYEMGNLYSDHPGFDIACARLAGEYAGIVATRIALKQRRSSGKGEKRSRPKFPRADGYVSPPSPESDCREMKYELKHIGLFYARNNFDEALWIAEDLIYRIEKLEMPIRESANIESRYYNEPFEEILDARLSLMDDEIQITDRPIPRVFFLCGSILNHLKQFDEAKAVFKRGLDYNPVDFNLMSEYIAAVRRTSDLEKFKEQIERAFRIAFRARDIARCYRYLGSYYAEKKKYRAAIVCHALGMRYEKSPEGEAELSAIASGVGAEITPPDDREVARQVERFDIPAVPNRIAIALAAAFARYHHRRNQPAEEKYFRNILENELDKDKASSEFIRQTISEISKEEPV